MSKDVYHAKMRELQDSFGSRALADRLARHSRREAFTDDDRIFVEGLPGFLLATADADGSPDCSYKGAEKGHVKVTGERSLSFPSLDGNGMYRSLGNILANPKVGMLFIDYARPRR
ncbi:MAG: pyridoxamine 5'-phosphate oxidase family protein, partial [Pseudomonadota bacterium]